MSKGYFAIVQNGTHDYVRMAYALAMSIASTQKGVRKLSIAVDKNTTIPDKYKIMFDNVVEIPFNDDAELEDWKVHNKWKYYHMTPYDETVILDADMLFTNDVGHWWNSFADRSMTATSDVFTYRGDKVNDRHYRKTFLTNNLPNIYSAFFHFNKKSDLTEEFFKLVEYIFRNYNTFKEDFLNPPRQNWISADVIYAMAIKILDIENEVIVKNLNYPTFVHMKTNVQNWQANYSEEWNKHIGVYFNDNCELTVGNFKQTLPFHYHNKDFLTDSMIVKLEKKLGI
jgi:hypothetical protein